MKPRVIHIVGARPQFIKAAVVCRKLAELGDRAPFEMSMIHTGQHYDKMLSETIFSELEIPEPKHNLGVGSGETYSQIAKIIDALGPILKEEQPDAVMVYGDTDTTTGASVAVHKLGIPLIHLEAGVRVYLRNEQPEESNRVIADHCSSLCLTCTERASYNLRREGLASSRISLVGDPMYDLFKWALDQLPRLASASPEKFGLIPGQYYLSTIHRKENTASDELLVSLLESLDSASLPVLLPVHPRVRVMLDRIKWQSKGSLILTESLGYFDLISMLTQCKRVVTDSGGVIREAFFAGKPSIVPRITNPWTEIIEAGWTTGTECGDDLAEKLDNFNPTNVRPLGVFGDGNAGARIVDEVGKFVSKPRRDGPWHSHGFAEDLPATIETTMTYTNYQAMVKTLRDSGYEFLQPATTEEIKDVGKRIVSLRHDVEVSIPKALAMAKLENKLGIASTYFVSLRTSHYNVFSSEATANIKEILRLGHELGLLFDKGNYSELSHDAELAEAYRLEAAFLQGWFKCDVRRNRADQSALDLKCFGDDKGEWRDGHPLDSDEFKQRQPFELLIHPVWWNDNPVTPYENMLRFSQHHFDLVEQSLLKLLHPVNTPSEGKELAE